MTQEERDLLDHEIFIYLQQYYYSTIDGITIELIEEYANQWMHLKKNATEHTRFCRGPWNPCDRCIVEYVESTARLYEQWRNRHIENQ
jgi:hypothetical protein